MMCKFQVHPSGNILLDDTGWPQWHFSKLRSKMSKWKSIGWKFRPVWSPTTVSDGCTCGGPWRWPWPTSRGRPCHRRCRLSTGTSRLPFCMGLAWLNPGTHFSNLLSNPVIILCEKTFLQKLNVCGVGLDAFLMIPQLRTLDPFYTYISRLRVDVTDNNMYFCCCI